MCAQGYLLRTLPQGVACLQQADVVLIAFSYFVIATYVMSYEHERVWLPDVTLIATLFGYYYVLYCPNFSIIDELLRNLRIEMCAQGYFIRGHKGSMLSASEYNINSYSNFVIANHDILHKFQHCK